MQKCSYLSKEMRKTLLLQLSIARNDGYVGGSQYSPVLIKLNFHKILPFLFDTAKVALKKILILHPQKIDRPTHLRGTRPRDF